MNKSVFTNTCQLHFGSGFPSTLDQKVIEWFFSLFVKQYVSDEYLPMRKKVGGDSSPPAINSVGEI